MTDEKRALLGDHEAAKRLTDAGVLLPCPFHYIEVGGCDDCRWRNRPQKCSCCRRNLHIKDCYEREAQP